MTQRDGQPWLQRFARFGYAAKGIVYILIGSIAARAALGRGAATDSRGALRSLGQGTFGRIELAAIAIGLAGYVVWRVYSTIANPENDSTAARASHTGTATLYAGLGLQAARLALARPDHDSGDRTAHWTARLLAQPFGRILVEGVGVGVAGYGVRQIYRGVTADLDDQLNLSPLRRETAQWVVRVARFGITARGVVFLLIAFFLVRAGITYDPGTARGLGGALESLKEQPFGSALLGVAAFGLFAYGFYSLVLARYRSIRI